MLRGQSGESFEKLQLQNQKRVPLVKNFIGQNFSNQKDSFVKSTLNDE